VEKMNIQSRDTSSGHFYASMIKSVLRIAAGACVVTAGYSLTGTWLVAAGVLLIMAEILGIAEEMI
jgi:hypothetical protein